MQHRFEFVAKLINGTIYHMNYVGKSSRHSKVTGKILEDLKRVYNVDPSDVQELYLKPIKNDNGKPTRAYSGGVEEGSRTEERN
jgi:hypothetical protein